MQICEILGMNLPTYPRMCMARLIQEQGIPFSMKLASENVNPGIADMKKASMIAAELGVSNKTLDEISIEIAKARKRE